MALSFQDKITAVPQANNPSLSFANKITPVTPGTNIGDVFNNIGTGAYNYSKDVVNSTFDNAKSAVQNIKTDITTNPYPGSQVIGGISDLANLILSPISGTIGATVKNTSDLISQNPTVQKVATSPIGDVVANTRKALMDWQAQHPVASKALMDTINVATIAAGGKEVPTDIANTGSDINAIKTALTPKPTIPEIPKPNVLPPELQGVANDWQKPTTINTASFNNARAVLEKSPETPKFTAEQGLNPFAHIEDGKYITDSSAQKLRDTAAKLSTDTLRPSLQMADYTVPKTPVADLTKIEIPKAEFNVTAGDAEKIKSNVTSELDALQRKYPDGMSLTNMHDERIIYDQNGGYKPYKSSLENNQAIANRTIANSLRTTLDSKVPSDIPMRDFNSYLSKYYKAADYLDALNNKKAPVSIGQKLVRLGSGIAGAKFGSFFGGGIVTEFAGYQIGKALEHMLENLTNPMRDSFLRNLKITNPEAFNKVSQYISNQEIQRANMLRLPSGQTNGTSNVINLGPAADKSGVKLVPAQKLRPTTNPKTGKIQKTYSSNPNLPPLR